MRATSFALLVLLANSTCLFPQGLNDTTQTKDQWEEINFEFDSSVLSDGYPSLLRLADLLKQHPDYKVKIDGNTDWVGSNRYNDKLSMRRAQTVKEFLLKYGASPNQIEIAAQGKKKPEVPNKSREGRFMNRRVVLTVMDGQGRVVSAAGVGEAISALGGGPGGDMRSRGIPGGAMGQDCCTDILKRLDKLDEILAMLKDLKGENDRLKQEVEALKNKQAGLQQQVAAIPPAPTSQEIGKIVEKETDRAIEKAKPSRFSLLSMNAGADDQGRLTFTGKGRFFTPMGKSGTHAFQAEAEYMRWYDRQEGQFDFGLLNRYSNFQLGLFSSFKHVNIRDLRAGGTLGQGSVTFDWLFGRGRIGIFGAKGYLDNAVLARTRLSPNFALESYLKLVDQIGASASIGLIGNTYVEGNLGYLKSPGHVDRPGGSARLVFPLNSRFAFTVEGGMNETLLTNSNSGRVAFGFQLGNWMRPKEFKGMNTPVPADIPRVRYELLSRRVRTGIGTPVADAGPDQIGVPAGTITLNGSGSYDPDGEPLTYQWSQIAGPTVALSSPTSAITTYTSVAGQSYAFRLTVKNPEQAQGTARTTVTTQATPSVRILKFTASPAAIKLGDTTLILWQVENADQVTLNGTVVDPRSGTSTFAPKDNTTYTLVARNTVSQANETVTVTVTQPAQQLPPRILLFQAAPSNINKGDSSTVTWATENADRATISGDIGAVALSGSRTVTPPATVTYTLTASNAAGQVTANVTITVQAAPPPPTGTAPRIIRFIANPNQITAGQACTLGWQVENSDNQSIDNGVGTVPATGSSDVKPAATITYTLTANNQFGQSKASATCTVTPVQPPPVGPPKVQVIYFIATPTYSPKPGADVILQWQTANAITVAITNLTGKLPLTGATTLRPTVNTTYVLTATSANGDTATATVTVTVPGPTPPLVPNQPPVANAGPNAQTFSALTYLDGSHSSDPTGGTLKYLWTAITPGAVIVDPTFVSPAVNLGGSYGDYVFTLKVTNSAGVSATSTVTITYVPGYVPGTSKAPPKR